MVDQARRFRTTSWVGILYCVIAIIILCASVSSSMDEIHGAGGFSPSPVMWLSLAGTLIGLIAAAITFARMRQFNSNLRAALLAFLFGAVIFALGGLAARQHAISDEPRPNARAA